MSIFAPALRPRRVALLGVGVAAIALAACQLIGPQSTAGEEPTPEPRRLLTRPTLTSTPGATGLTAVVARGDLTEALTLSGNAVPLVTTQLAFRGSGTVLALRVRPGETVVRGQRLADLDGDNGLVAMTAPQGGLILSVDVTVGQLVNSGTTVVRLADTSGFYVVANASEFEVLRLRPDLPAEVTFPALSNVPLVGRVTDITQVGSIQGDRVSFPVRIDLNSVPGDIKAGMSARVNVPIRRAENALHVPAAAVRQVGPAAFVAKVEANGQMRDVQVQVGGTYSGETQILGGLTEGDVVVVLTAPLR